jgi:NADH dehydrogenase
MNPSNAEHRARVVIVGAGFGGLAAARALHGAPVDVVLVDRHNYHTFQPLLYQVATAGLEPEEIAYAVRAIFHRQRNVQFRLGDVSEIAWDEKRLVLAGGDALEYDFLIVAAGASTNDFGIEGVAEHALALKSLEDAIRLRSHVLARFEAAAEDPALVEGGALSFVIVGGGPTGVEMAGALVELIHLVLRKDHPEIPIERVRVILIEREANLLGTFHPDLQRYARKVLEKRRVEVITGASVKRARADAVELDDGRTIAAHTLIWAAGVRASPLADRLARSSGANIEQTRGGRMLVAPDLSLPGHPEVFIVGDMAASRDAHGRLHPQLAPVAIQGARHAARTIERRLKGATSSAFVYTDRGTMATIGRNAAVCELRGGVRTRGFVAWCMWLALHLVQLIGFRNRAIVLVNWAWNYFTYDRGARLILGTDRDETRARVPDAHRAVQRTKS